MATTKVVSDLWDEIASAKMESPPSQEELAETEEDKEKKFGRVALTVSEGEILFSEWAQTIPLITEDDLKQITMPDFPLRVYTPSDWDTSVQMFIPNREKFTHWLPNVLDLYLAVRTITFGDNLRLIGESGGGKSMMSEAIAAFLGMPFARVNCKNDMDTSDLVGGISLKNDGGTPVTCLLKSPLLQVFEHGGICNVDEFGRAPSGVNMTIQAPLEPNSKWIVPEADNAVIPRHERTVWIISDNTAGVGDGLDKYTSSLVQDVSTLNRLPVTLVVGYLDSKSETRVLKSQFSDISVRELKKIVKFAGLVRNAFERGEVALPFSTRTTANVCRYLPVLLDPKAVIKMVYSNGLGEDAAKSAVDGMVGMVWGKGS